MNNKMPKYLSIIYDEELGALPSYSDESGTYERIGNEYKAVDYKPMDEKIPLYMILCFDAKYGAMTAFAGNYQDAYDTWSNLGCMGYDVEVYERTTGIYKFLYS